MTKYENDKYLTGVAEGILEGYKNTRKELEELKSEIEELKVGYPPNADEYKTIVKVVNIINKHIKEYI